MTQQEFIIQRYNPDTDESYEESFDVDVQPGQTVLDSLNAIKWEQDGTLSFRMSCRHAICGSCAMKVNGQSMLTCQTQVDAAAERGDPIRVGPQGNQNVVKDLVVDVTKFLDQFERAETWLEPYEDQEPPEKEYRQNVEEFDHWSHASTCIHCGACYSDCTVAAVDENFLGPAALAKAYRFVMDSRDSKREERLKFLSEEQGGIWDCTRCYMCVQACPKDVLPMDAIMELRTMAIEAGHTNNHGFRHHKGFTSGVRKRGRLDEMMLPVQSVGIARLLTGNISAHKEMMDYTPGAIRLLKSRKLLTIAQRHGANAEGREQIQRIFDEVEAEKHHHDVDADAFSAEFETAIGGH